MSVRSVEGNSETKGGWETIRGVARGKDENLSIGRGRRIKGEEG